MRKRKKFQEEKTEILSSRLVSCNELKNNVLQFIKNDLRQQNGIFAPTIVETLKIYPHRKAVLIDHDGDLSKRWYIEYYQWHKDKEQLVRKRVYKGFSDYGTYKARKAYGNKLKKLYNQNIPFFGLTNEHTREVLGVKPPPEVISLKEAFTTILEIKHPISRNKKTHLTFKSICAKFEKFCADHGVHTHSIKKITPQIAQEYVDYMVRIKEYSPTTVWNNVNALSTLFNNLAKRGFLETNPFKGIERPKRSQTRKNIAFTADEVEVIKQKALETNPQLWKIIQVIYYTYLRPIEIGRLKVQNILPDQLKIFVPASMSKNNKDSYLELPEPLLPAFEGIEQLPSDYYLFGKDGFPSPKKIGENWMRRKHREVLKLSKVTDEGKTLYSWKHTGVVEAYKAGIDIKAIQLQCRHHSIQQTDTYLKSLGFVENTNFRLGVKEI